MTAAESRAISHLDISAQSLGGDTRALVALFSGFCFGMEAAGMDQPERLAFLDRYCPDSLRPTYASIKSFAKVQGIIQ